MLQYPIYTKTPSDPGEIVSVSVRSEAFLMKSKTATIADQRFTCEPSGPALPETEDAGADHYLTHSFVNTSAQANGDME